ncbi:MAG: cation:proton antiporter [Flavobacteriales bacterium]
MLFASQHASRFFQKVKLPLITGFLVAGMICGPYVLGFIPQDAVSDLLFVNDLALAFIALAAGNELFLKNIRTQIRSILWNVFGQLVVTFGFSALAVFLLADYIPFMSAMGVTSKVAVSILIATIFIARSPSSAIAVINEMRAKGPFTQISIGVTVIKDVLVILLFAICFSMARTLISGDEMDPLILLLLVAELFTAVFIGYGLARLIMLVFNTKLPVLVKRLIILALGYAVFFVSHQVAHFSTDWTATGFHYEPLLACIIASFYVTNYSRYRVEFQRFIERFGPGIYVAFFTLTGATLSIDVLRHVWLVALILFVVRLLSLVLGSVSGMTLAGDPPLFRKIGWMPFVTQAGVGLGLATEVALEFPEWGGEFSSIIIAVIVLNQFIGPPLFKWSLMKVGEAKLPAKSPEYDGQRDVFIFGPDIQGWALARQLSKHGWNAEVVGLTGKYEQAESSSILLHQLERFEYEYLESIQIEKADAIVLLLSDEENLKLCNMIFERVGTKEVIVRLNNHRLFDQFHSLGALIVEPATAMVSLLDQFVRSPVAASLLLGLEGEQHAMDIEVRDKDMHGVYIRDLRLPSDTIILSIKRRGDVLVPHGYTRLRVGDIVSIVGSNESRESVRLKFE